MDSYAEEQLAAVENNGDCAHMVQSGHKELNGSSVHTAITGTSVIEHTGNTGQAGFSGHVVNFGHGGHAGSGGHSGSEINAHDIYSGPTGTHCRERNGSSGNAENCGNGVQSDRAVTDDSDNSPTYDSNSGVNFNGTKIHGSNQNTPSNGTPYYQQQGLVLGIPQSQSLTHPAMPSYPGLMEYSCPSAGIYQQLEGVYLPGYYTVSPQVGVQQTQQGQQQGQQQQGRQQQASPVFIHDNHPSKFVRQKPIQFLHSFNGQVMLAVFVLICFLGAFGLVALILAVVARIKSKRDPLTARRIGKASLIVSVIGAVCGIIFYIVLAKITLSRASSSVVLPEFSKNIN